MLLNNRTRMLELEHETLSGDACFSDQATVALGGGGTDGLRSEFQRDRDKIIHSKAFRRLSHKTQVFISPEGDHYRSRLTHTLEVTQIARTIARALGLNEDLCEAIALGHDLGHTPFGHTGEYALQACLRRYREAPADGAVPARANLPVEEQFELENGYELFSHNRQSLRVVELIENGGRGLRLSEQVKDGIVCHTGPVRAKTLEGRIVHFADRIAYVNHDVDDAIRAKLLDPAQLPADIVACLGATHAQRIETLVLDCVNASLAAGDICLSEEAGGAMLDLRSFLFEKVYRSDAVLVQVRKAFHLVEDLFDFLMDHFDMVPVEYRELCEGDKLVAVCDHIASMTDRYALRLFEERFIPQPTAFLVGN